MLGRSKKNEEPRRTRKKKKRERERDKKEKVERCGAKGCRERVREI